MNRLVLGIPDFAKIGRALLVSVLGLGLVALWPSIASGQTSIVVGPRAVLDSATDDGDGKIRISWSLTQAPSGRVYLNDHPDEVCVRWAEVVDGERGSTADTCFTSEASSQADLVVDTGIGGNTPPAEYAVLLLGYYDGAMRNPPNNDFTYTNVTLNDEDNDDETPSVGSA